MVIGMDLRDKESQLCVLGADNQIRQEVHGSADQAMVQFARSSQVTRPPLAAMGEGRDVARVEVTARLRRNGVVGSEHDEFATE